MTDSDNKKPKTYYQTQLEAIAARYDLPPYIYVQLRQSKDFMDRYYADKIEIYQIALAACMSRFHYIRLFQKVYGLTPRQYLRDVRINKAKQLIQAGLSIVNVCAEVGYDSLPTFSTAFREGTGVSPRSYQASYKSNPE